MKSLLAIIVIAGIGMKIGAMETVLLEGWRFFRGEEHGAQALDYDDSSWESVRIPHDWAIAGPFDRTNDLQVTKTLWEGETIVRTHTGRTGGLPWVGKGWYRRSLDIPKGTEYAELVFDGAMSAPTVYADGKKVGEWKYGYSSFIVPIPPATRKIAVSLENKPASSRWYPGSGLIRPVRLVTGGKVGIRTWGNYIRTTSLTREKAAVAVTSRLRGNVNGCNLEWRMYANDGTLVAITNVCAVSDEVSAELSVLSPHIWSPENPYLYRLETVLKKSGLIVDRRVDRVGLRTAEFTKDGFFLNGAKRPFKGVCLHHDLGPLGAAFNKAAFRRQIKVLKEIGVDSIRTSHNMPAPDQMDICDEEGIMVMAESFDTWTADRTPNDYSIYFKDWWRKDLKNLLECHRNHPSIVIWSIGNEIQDKDVHRVRDIAKEMTDMCHQADPTRPVVLVTDRPDALTESGAIQVTDVPALTYRLHRYKFMHEHSPIGLVLGGETASTFSSRGCYHFPDVAKVNIEHEDGQSSSYDLEHGSWSNLPDDDWAMQDDNIWAIGEFVWTGFDYLGEPTPYKTYWPSRSSYFGIFDLAGLPKDRAWLYRTRWRKDSPTLHILPHWTWPDREGKVTPVYVYTTYPEAELFVNGVSQGRRKFDKSSRLDRYRLRWRDVVYRSGEIKVVAYDAHGTAVDEKTVHTAGEPHHLEVAVDRTCLVAPKAEETPDLAFMTVRVCDKDGNLCPDAAIKIKCSAKGSVAFKAMCNGDATSLEPFVKPQMHTFRGELVAVAEAISVGDGVFALTAEGLPTVQVSLSVKESISLPDKSGTASIRRVNGVPRIVVDGEAMSATAVMPSPAGKPGDAEPYLRDFYLSGARFSSDVWTMHDKRYNPRQWWIGEGEYDFRLFDSIVKGLIDATPDGFIFPRIKIDPPAKWCKEHPEEMMTDISPWPDSKAWKALYRQMLKDVIEHVEKSEYSNRVIGYHVGAFFCGEWLISIWNSKIEKLLKNDECDDRNPLVPMDATLKRRKAIDYISTSTADMLVDAASFIKERTHNRKIVGAFFGYHSLAHEKLSRILNSGVVDFLAAPPHYHEFREPGQAGCSQTYYQGSYRLHGIVYFEETDYRTFLSDPAFAPYRYTQRRPLADSVSLIRRSIGNSLCGGWENWYFLLGGNKTYSDPYMMESIRIGAEESKSTYNTNVWKPAEVAVFTSSDEYLTSMGSHLYVPSSTFSEWCVGKVHKNELPRCGVPFDSYELSDILNPQLPDYKVYLFLNAFTLSAQMREQMKEKVRKSGKTALWVFAPGYYGIGEGSLEKVSDMVGVPLKFRKNDKSCHYKTMISAVGNDTCERDGWRSVFLPEPPDAAVLREAFRSAGVHVWMNTDDVLSAGRGYLMVHASSPGLKEIQLPGHFDAQEIFNATLPLENVSMITERMKRGETRVWRLKNK